jgi:hypothetical protein
MKRAFFKRAFMSFLAIFFPWIILLIDDNPGGAFVALVLQATAIGWIPASVWAWRIVHGTEKKVIQKENMNP